MVLRYSPGFYPFSNTSPGTHPGPSLVLAQISIFLIHARIPHFRYSPGSYFFRYSPGFPISGTHSDSPFSILVWIPHFRYSPGFPIFGTHPDSPFSVLTRIPHFRYSLGSYLFWYSLESYLFRYSPGFYLLRYSLRSHISGSRPDRPFLILTRILHFLVLARILPSQVLAQIPHFR